MEEILVWWRMEKLDFSTRNQQYLWNGARKDVGLNEYLYKVPYRISFGTNIVDLELPWVVSELNYKAIP